MVADIFWSLFFWTVFSKTFKILIKISTAAFKLLAKTLCVDSRLLQINAPSDTLIWPSNLPKIKQTR